MPGCFLPQELCGGVDKETQVKEQGSPCLTESVLCALLLFWTPLLEKVVSISEGPF